MDNPSEPGLLLTFARRLTPDQDATDSHALTRLTMFAVVLLAQAVTIAITWKTWSVREYPPNLPLLTWPELSFGPIVLVSLLGAAVRPRPGVLLHGAVLVVACLFDQHRLEPQFFALWVLMWASVSPRGAWFARWFLASMWLWAGLHKWLSPQWYGVVSWNLLERSGFNGDYHVQFAVIVAAMETTVGLAAIFIRKAAAVLCALQHVGIVIFLSPLVLNWNVSVFPWNLATAVVGAWLFWTAPAPVPTSVRQWAVIAALYAIPATYYAGWINPHMAHILYSEHLPKAWITTREGTVQLHAWGGGLNVPYPDSHWLFLQSFRQRAAAGDKMYIQDQRWLIEDRYFVMDASDHVVEIDRRRFLKPDEKNAEIAGIEFDDANAAFWLKRRGAKLEYDPRRLATSAKLHGQAFGDEDLERVSKLPNVLDLEIHNARVSGEGLSKLSRLSKLELLDLQGTPLEGEPLAVLSDLTGLKWLGLNQTGVGSGAFKHLPAESGLEVLHLRETNVDDDAVATIARLSELAWLDLADTDVTNRGVAQLGGLRKLEWLDVSGTRVDDEGLAALSGLPTLEILMLDRTRVGDEGLTHLQSLPLKRLSLRDTNVTAAAIDALQRALPDCRITSD